MLTIEIIADFVCPWCFIGRRRAQVAIERVRARRPDFSCRTIWRPFFLNPDSPPLGEPYLPFLESKFGSRAAVEELFARIRQAGAAYDIEYAFEKISVRANTLQAHRLMHLAQQHGDGDAVALALFTAQFQRGENIGDIAVLRRIGEECALDAAVVADYLAGEKDAQLIIDREAEARALGVNVVPSYIVAGGEVIPGAEDPDILARAIEAALDAGA